MKLWQFALVGVAVVIGVVCAIDAIDTIDKTDGQSVEAARERAAKKFIGAGEPAGRKVTKRGGGRLTSRVRQESVPRAGGGRILPINRGGGKDRAFNQ